MKSATEHSPCGVIDLLPLTAALVEYGWCQGTAAKNALGLSVSPLSHQAEQFCLLGAIRRAMDELELPLSLCAGLAQRMGKHLGMAEGDPLYLMWQLTFWQDHNLRTVEPILALLSDLAGEKSGK